MNYLKFIKMRKVVLGLFVSTALVLTSCNNAASKIEDSGSADATAAGAEAQAGTPAFSFTEEKWDFGTIDEGTVAKHTFEFTNTGDAPLIIHNAQGSCGCTVPVWPREPIAPGATGTIEVSFSSAGKPGANNKQVTLTANTVPNKKVLNITASVTAKPAADAQPTEAK